MAQQRGALVCWNMPTFTGTEQADGNLAPDTFAPTGLNIDQWLDACVSADMRYACLIVKHPDGFALYPTTYHVGANPPYSIAQTAWYAANGNPDVVGQFVTKCREHGLNPCLYFSIWDKTHEIQAGGITQAAYVAMVTTQLTELLTNYGNITAIWTDGWGWHTGYTTVPYATVYNLIKSLQPNCLLIENNHTHPGTNTQIEVYETPTDDGSIPVGNTRLSEEVDTPRPGDWFWHVDGGLTSSATILAAIANANLYNGTYMLAVRPNQAGVVPSDQVTLLGELGA